jgi:hypothetical protein
MCTPMGLPGHGTPDPHPHPHPRFAGDRGWTPDPRLAGDRGWTPDPRLAGDRPHWHPHPRFAGDRGSTPIPIPDLPESGIQLSTIEYCKGVKFRLPQCLTLRLIASSPESSGIAGTEYGRLPWLALSVMSSHASNAASEGCHSIAQLIMSDLHWQTSMGDDILQMIVCLRDGKEAVEQLKAMYPQ